jgi:hypothetical protein
LSCCRPLEINSPWRSVLDFCDDACLKGTGPGPKVTLGPTGKLYFTRVFLKNFVPPQATAEAFPDAFDLSSPIPFVHLEGTASLSFYLLTMHWLRPMMWILQSPGSAWQAINTSPTPPQAVGYRAGDGEYGLSALPDTHLFLIKAYSVNSTDSSSSSISLKDTYMPYDANNCFAAHEPEATLVYW